MPSNSISGENRRFFDNIPKSCLSYCEFYNDERYNHGKDLYPSILGISDSKSETEFIIRKLNEVEYIDSLDTTIEPFDFCQTILKSLLPQVLNGPKPDQEVIFGYNNLNSRQNIVNMGDTASEKEFIEDTLKELECIESIDRCTESHQICQSIMYHILFKSVPNTANNEFNLDNLPILSRHENVLGFIEGTKQFLDGYGLHEGFHSKTLSAEKDNILYSNKAEFDSEWDSVIGSCYGRETNCFLLPGKSPDSLDLDSEVIKSDFNHSKRKNVSCKLLLRTAKMLAFEENQRNSTETNQKQSFNKQVKNTGQNSFHYISPNIPPKHKQFGFHSHAKDSSSNFPVNIKSSEENISITTTEGDNHAPQNIDGPTEATEHGHMKDNSSTVKRGKCTKEITSCLPQRATGPKIMIPLTVKFSGGKVRLLKVSLKPLVETMLSRNTTCFCLGILTGVGTGYSMASMIHNKPKINNKLDK